MEWDRLDCGTQSGEILAIHGRSRRPRLRPTSGEVTVGWTRIELRNLGARFPARDQVRGRLPSYRHPGTHRDFDRPNGEQANPSASAPQGVRRSSQLPHRPTSEFDDQSIGAASDATEDSTDPLPARIFRLA